MLEFRLCSEFKVSVVVKLFCRKSLHSLDSRAGKVSVKCICCGCCDVWLVSACAVMSVSWSPLQLVKGSMNEAQVAAEGVRFECHAGV